MQWLFWLAVLGVLYTYLGYPLFLLALVKIRPKPVAKEGCQPTVSVVIAARNEEKNISARLQNLLEQDYPRENLEIIVVSDGSEDGTNAIVERLTDEWKTAHRGVPVLKLISYVGGRGKPFALKAGVTAASGEIVVFTDSRQRFAPDAIQQMVGNFADPEVGCVSGELVFYKDSDSGIRAEMGAYWSYEKLIRRTESATGSVVGATGAIYAIRRRLYKLLPDLTILDDVLTPLHIAYQGYRVVFERSAVAFDVVSADVKKEWHRKVRTLAGNWQLLGLKPDLLLPWRNPLWFRFLSHKLLRLTVPLFLVLALLASAQEKSFFFVFCTWLQVGMYGAAVLGGVVPVTRRLRLVNFIYFFAVLNLAAAVGFWTWISRGCGSVWQRGATGRGVVG